MCNSNLLTLSTFLHLGKANEFALLSVYETSSTFEVLSASCCLSYSPLRYRKVHWTFLHIACYAPLFYAMPPWSVGIAFGTAIESHWLSSCTAICSILRSAIESHWLSSYSKSQEMNL